MSKLDLAHARRIKSAAGELVGLKGAGFNWQRPPLAPYYGVGPGKIAIHIDPTRAVEAGGNVTRVPNRGGGGAYFDAIAAAGVTRNGAELGLSGGSDFKLANSADIQGVRLFIPAYRTVSAQAYFMGAVSSGVSTSVRYVHSGSSDMVMLFAASDGGISPSPGAVPRGIGAWALIEIEMTATATRVWHNGAEVAAGGGRSTPYLVQQIGRHPDMITTPTWSGKIGDIVGVTLGGGDAAAIAATRSYLASRYQIGLAR